MLCTDKKHKSNRLCQTDNHDVVMFLVTSEPILVLKKRFLWGKGRIKRGKNVSFSDFGHDSEKIVVEEEKFCMTKRGQVTYGFTIKVVSMMSEFLSQLNVFCVYFILLSW